MKLGIMQPYFFPYLGYFDLINRTDQWVVFDTAQYIRHGWVNRNRILHPVSGWQYIVVPLKQHHQSVAINSVEVQPYASWAPRIIGQLQHYKKKAPGFNLVMDLVKEVFGFEETNLGRLNIIALEKTCARLGIAFKYEVFSEMKCDLGPVGGAGDWALRIAEAMKAAEYVNPPGGRELFDSSLFAASGIKLTIQSPFEFDYRCHGYEFVPGLSVLDALMWNEPAKIKAHLDVMRQL